MSEKNQINLNEVRKHNLNRYLDSTSSKKSKKNLISFFLSNIYINDFFYKILLRIFGIKVGKNVVINGCIDLTLNGPPSNIIIEDNVYIERNTSIKIRENGQINLKKGSYLDQGVRLLAARDGKITLGKYSQIGKDTILNSGGEIEIGCFCLISSHCHINSSQHKTIKENFIIAQNYDHGKVIILDDVLIGTHCTILMGAKLSEGAILGSNSLLKDFTKPFGIYGGSPAKLISFRK